MSSTSLYSTLPFVNSIRLLYLHPGVEDGTLLCSLSVVDNYELAPEYIALSYCWGNPNDTINVSCNGLVLSVTKNLYAALNRLQQKALPQLVWADAICINQENILERNQQVSIMRQIYRKASCVLVWAGPSNKHSVSAMNTIRSIGHGCCMELYGPDSSPASWLTRLRQEPDRTQVVLQTSLVELKDLSHVNWAPVWHFYHSDWFFRVWVIQEVRENPSVHFICGKEEIEWDFVALAANWICHAYERDRTVHWKKDHFPSFGGFQNAFFMYQFLGTRREAPFPALLNLVRNFSATDPRDKVFALLQHPIFQIQACEPNQDVLVSHPSSSSGTAPATHFSLKADYNMQLCEVLRKVTLSSIQHYGNLEVLCYAWQPAHTESSYPSWIPRWGVVNDSINYTPLLPFLYDATRGISPRLQCSAEENCLTLQGLYLGSLVETDNILRFAYKQDPGCHAQSEDNLKASLMTMSRILVQDRWQEEVGLESAAERTYKNSHAHFADFSAYLLPLLEAQRGNIYISLYSTWCDECKQHISEMRQPTLEPSKGYSCRVCNHGDFDLCNHCYDSGKRCENEKHALKRITRSTFWCPYTDEIVSQLRSHANTGDGDRFFDIARSACRSRIFFRTAQGWSGIGPTDLEPGDILVVLFGSRVPFILRKTGTSYRLVCSCYVHDLMDGEAIQMWEEGKLHVENFVIC